MALFVPFVTVLLFGVSVSLLPVPKRYDGFRLNDSPAAPIQFEAFFDLLCPYSRAAWPVMRQLVQHYSTDISVNIHVFPLPFHRNSFLAAQAAHFVHTETDLLWPFVDSFFEQQDAFANQPTENMTALEVTAAMSSVASAVGVDPGSFRAGVYPGTASDTMARSSWKYGCSRTSQSLHMLSFRFYRGDAPVSGERSTDRS